MRMRDHRCSPRCTPLLTTAMVSAMKTNAPAMPPGPSAYTRPKVSWIYSTLTAAKAPVTA